MALVYCVVYTQTGRFLIGTKRQTAYWFCSTLPGNVYPNGFPIAHGGGKVAFPGGALNANETPANGAMREFLEETGVAIGSQGAGAAVPPAQQFTDQRGNNPQQFYAYYYQVSDVNFNNYLAAIQAKLAETAEAITDVNNQHITTCANLLEAFQGDIPKDNELASMASMDLNNANDQATILGWRNDNDLDWFYCIARRLANFLGINGFNGIANLCNNQLVQDFAIQEEENTMNIIPGASALGAGFNVLGEYGISSLTQQLFSQTNQNGTQWQYQPTKITYTVPDNVSVHDYTHTTGSTQVFNTRDQFKNHFAAKASLSGSIGVFSGQFDFAYSATTNTETSYFYGLSEANYNGWKLSLASESDSLLSSNFTDDPLFLELPITFSDANKDKFYAFFRKFGTHFVAGVTVGGSLDYYVAVEKSFSSNEQAIDSKLSLEYKAVFFSAKAEAEVEWNQLGQQWADSRVVHVSTIGGDSSPLNALNPVFGDSDSNIFQGWTQSVMQNPSVIEFDLKPLSLLFVDEQATAVNQAIEAYLNAACEVSTSIQFARFQGPNQTNYLTSAQIIMNGKAVPATEANSPTAQGLGISSGYQISLFNPTTYDPILSKIYYAPQAPQNPLSIYDTIMADIQAVKETDYICAVAAFAVDVRLYPTKAFRDWLVSCGASLTEWSQNLNISWWWGLASYLCIGQTNINSGNAIENFAMVQNWSNNPTIVSQAEATAVALLSTNQIEPPQ